MGGEITIMNEHKEISYTQELLRKSIHLLSLGIPLIYSYVDKTTGLWLLLPVTTLFLATDILSHRNGWVRQWVMKYFGGMMRSHELRSDKFLLNGASYVLLSACLCVIIFPKIIAITAFTVLIISDICAALFGRKFGKHKFLDKSLEGTSAFIISAFIVVAIIGNLNHAPWTFYASGMIASVAGGIIENISIRLRMDDNFSIPATIGVIMWILALTLYAHQEPYLSLM